MLITMHSEESLEGILKRRLLVTSWCSRTNFQYKLERRNMRWRGRGSSQVWECCLRFAVTSLPTQIFSSFKSRPTLIQSLKLHSLLLLNWITLVAWCCFWLSSASQNWQELLPSKPSLLQVQFKSNLLLCQGPPSPVLGKRCNFGATSCFGPFSPPSTSS